MEKEKDGTLAPCGRGLLLLVVILGAFLTETALIHGQSDAPVEAIAADERVSDPRLQRRASPEATIAGEESSGWRYFRALGVVAGVLGVGLVGFWFFRRFIPGAITGNDSSLIKVLSRVPISPRHQVALIRVGERIIVVGVSPERIDRLTEINDPDEVFRLTPEVPIKEQFTSVESDIQHLDEKTVQVMPPEFQRDVERVRNLVASWGDEKKLEER